MQQKCIFVAFAIPGIYVHTYNMWVYGWEYIYIRFLLTSLSLLFVVGGIVVDWPETRGFNVFLMLFP